MDRLLFGVEWKTAGSSTGELDGYMSVFGNVDLGNDVVMPGAFKKTFADWSRAKSPMPLIDGHQLTGDGVIGSVTHMAEDGVGARIRAKFSSIPKAQEIRTKMIEGHLRGMSMTYEPILFDFGLREGKQVRFLREVRAYEATVTPVPMNQLALASAKADEPGREIINLDLLTFLSAMRHLSEIPILSVQKAAVDRLIPLYHPETDAAELTDGQPTADAAADTEQPAAGTAETKETKTAYAVSFLNPTPPEPPDGALDPLAALKAAQDAAEADRLEALLARGGHHSNA
jgi:HK97 family phage prohead protease